MAEGAVPPPEQLEQWIPKGHDIYVIGVQECIDLRTMRHVMASHLQRINGKEFVEYGREIGRTETLLGYHGFIAITVYVAADDVHASHFHMHLDAMSKGKSKIKKRHHDGASILTNMHLQSIENEFDCHLMAHHTIFMGDLNYRLTALDATPDRILHMITDVVNNNLSDSTIKRGELYRSSVPAAFDIMEEHDRKREGRPTYVLTHTPKAEVAIDDARSSSTTMHPSDAPPLSTTTTTMSSWRCLMAHDELKQSMDNGDIFAAFEEASIAFPPTYRRVLDRALEVRQVATFDQIADLYTTILSDGRVRVPSYTDRILYHSLPMLQDRFICVQYTSAEYIGTSDHKPVSCVFDVWGVDKQPPPVATALAIKQEPCASIPLPLNTCMAALKVFTVHLVALDLVWGPPLEKLSDDDWTSDDDGSTSGGRDKALSWTSSAAANLADPRGEGRMIRGHRRLRVRSLFPLPCEDEFAEERKLAEVADHFQPHVGAKTRRRPTWKVSEWKTVADQGMRQSAVLPTTRRKHVALSFVLPCKMGDENDDACTPQVTGTAPMTPKLSRTQSDMSGLGSVQRRRVLTHSSKRALFSSPESALDSDSKRARSLTDESGRRRKPTAFQEAIADSESNSFKENELPPALVPSVMINRSLSSPGPSTPLHAYTPLLPLIKSSKHPDLNVISPSTVEKLLDGTYNDVLHTFHLIDCRFQHEFLGGTLRGARSLALPQHVEAAFFQPQALRASTRTALILFCEFSAERAPKMARHIRNIDRRIHADVYPTLHYPEVYVIDGGYKHCFESVNHDMCLSPAAAYVPMNHPDHVDACKMELSGLRSSWKQLRSTPFSKRHANKWC
ncbi:hypothetical protein DYB26_003089 [Aphanomyces astaci]|uniref:Rhodanese domain-containing protein n=1 Tax=Aphanomyces astaci TaxID=112090 RepID=A0A418EU77_APHAT|nr:hypothetical protein DYB26_003089 [Aphanomyces astaci]